MNLDRSLYPRLAQYLDGLPQRLLAHPEARTKADFSLILRERLAGPLADARLPAQLKSSLLGGWSQGDWIPTTYYVALCAIARDQLWQTDAAYHQGMLDVALEMYKGPVYRTLFVMFGPSLVAMGSARRWHTLHQGTELVMKKQNKENVHLLLTYPSKLFSETAVQSLGAAFCAIAQASRGKEPQFRLTAFADTSAEMVISWTY